MNSRSGAKPEGEQRLCWACWCPQKNSVRQGCWLHLTRQEMWDFRNRTQKLSSLLSRRKINSPPVPELASFPQLSQTGYFVVLCSKTRKPTTLAAAAACVICQTSKWAWSSQVISCFALGREWSWAQGSDQLCSLDSCRQQEITYYTVSIIRGDKGSWEKWAHAQSSCNCSWWDLISRLIRLNCAPGTGTWEVCHQHSLGELTREETSLQEPCATRFPPGIRSC